MGLKIVAVLLVLLGAFAGFVAMQPADFTIARSAAIPAPAAIVFAQVDDFHNWSAWSPWEKLDPNLTRTFSGAASGNGAVYGWSSQDKKVGSGQMTITGAKIPESVDIKLDFLEPFKATNEVTFAFAPEGEGTKTTWTMKGQKNFIMKAFCLFNDMDKMVGPDFEKGLAGLAAVSEAKHKDAVAAAAAAEAQAQAAQAAPAPEPTPAPKAAPKGKAKKH